MRIKVCFGLFAFILMLSLISTTGYSQCCAGKSAHASEAKAVDEKVTCPLGCHEMDKSKTVSHDYNGKTYYFCSTACRDEFKADPEKFINRVKMSCCGGMKVDKASAIKVSYEGKDYFFCSEKCKETFEKDPKAYLEKMKTECKGKCAQSCSKKHQESTESKKTN